MTQSIQHKLDRVRPPRVHVTYDVETGGAIEVKELPFVMGVLGDFTGQPQASEPLKPLKDRKFIEVTPSNFDTVLASMKPHLAFSVKNTESKDPKTGRLLVDLQFDRIEAFDPDNVAMQVAPLAKLLAIRKKLTDLKSSLQGNDKLDQLLQEVISDSEKLRKLHTEVAGPAGPEGGAHE
jgi:type VI secretion system protein ImpB